jgi:hypothetical protein
MRILAAIGLTTLLGLHCSVSRTAGLPLVTGASVGDTGASRSIGAAGVQGLQGWHFSVGLRCFIKQGCSV